MKWGDVESEFEGKGVGSDYAKCVTPSRL